MQACENITKARELPNLSGLGITKVQSQICNQRDNSSDTPISGLGIEPAIKHALNMSDIVTLILSHVDTKDPESACKSASSWRNTNQTMRSACEGETQAWQTLIESIDTKFNTRYIHGILLKAPIAMNKGNGLSLTGGR